MSFSENLKSELTYQDVQVKELSAKTGINASTLGNYLSGHKSIPSADIAVKIAKALNVSVEYLVTGKTDELKNLKLSAKLTTLIKNFEFLDDLDQEAVQNLVVNLKKRY